MLHITIGTAPTEPASLEPDLRMVKAALLYADKVRLCSSGYSTWMPLFVNRNKTIEQVIKETYDIEGMIPKLLKDSEAIRLFLKFTRMARKILQNNNPSEQELKFIEWYQEISSKEFEFFSTEFPTLNLKEVNNEFEIAVKTGFLEIHKFESIETTTSGVDLINGNFQQSVEKMGEEFLDVILETVSNGSTYPLFDDGVGGLVNLSINVGVITPTQTRIAQAKQSKLASEILRRLPVFDEASMSEILDIRKELERHLIRFRSAIIKYSEKIKNESWNEEFLVEAEETFHREIEPAVLDIEDAVKSSSSLLALTTRKLVDKPALATTVGTSVFSYIVSQQILLPEIVKAAMAIGSIGIGAATAIYDAYKEHQKQSNTIEQNQLYFYYKAGKLIKK